MASMLLVFFSRYFNIKLGRVAQIPLQEQNILDATFECQTPVLFTMNTISLTYQLLSTFPFMG